MTEVFHLRSTNRISGTTGWITTVLKLTAAILQRLGQSAVPLAPPCGRTTSSASNLNLHDKFSRAATRNNARTSEAKIAATFVANHLVLLTHLEELMLCVVTFRVERPPPPRKSYLFHRAKILISTTKEFHHFWKLHFGPE
jgi:hypothetical protein